MSAAFTFLVVDDAFIIRHLVRRTLTRLLPSVAILDASGVENALALMQMHEITAIFTDFHLRDGTGLLVLAAARNQLPPIPVVCMSSDSSVERAVLDAGAVAFLKKPFALEQLRTVLLQLP